MKERRDEGEKEKRDEGEMQRRRGEMQRRRDCQRRGEAIQQMLYKAYNHHHHLPLQTCLRRTELLPFIC